MNFDIMEDQNKKAEIKKQKKQNRKQEEKKTFIKYMAAFISGDIISLNEFPILIKKVEKEYKSYGRIIFTFFYATIEGIKDDTGCFSIEIDSMEVRELELKEGL